MNHWVIISRFKSHLSFSLFASPLLCLHPPHDQLLPILLFQCHGALQMSNNSEINLYWCRTDYLRFFCKETQRLQKSKKDLWKKPLLMQIPFMHSNVIQYVFFLHYNVLNRQNTTVFKMWEKHRNRTVFFQEHLQCEIHLLFLLCPFISMPSFMLFAFSVQPFCIIHCLRYKKNL